VNRVLRALREEGVVTIRDGLVSIDSLELLVKRAYPLLDAYERASPAYVGSREQSRTSSQASMSASSE
jgi:hypothetical protein